MKHWDDQAVEQLRTLHGRKLSAARIGEIMGCSRNAVIGAVRRHIYAIPDLRTPEERRCSVQRIRKRASPSLIWTERALTETWVERKARLAKERAEL